MYFLESPDTRPEYNLALEEYLCRLKHGAFFMLWRNKPSVIIGRFQDAGSEVNAAFVSSRRIPVLRRDTGGGAVYHDLGNVNYSFIVPDRVEYGFARFAEKIISVLAGMGLNAEFSMERNDILIDGGKVSGMAQRRREGTLLCHGTLLFDCDLNALAQALNVPEEKLRRHGVQSVRGRVRNLKPLLPRLTDAEAFMASFWRAFQEGDNEAAAAVPFTLSREDVAEVARLMRGKYLNAAWNDNGIWNDEGIENNTERGDE